MKKLIKVDFNKNKKDDVEEFEEFISASMVLTEVLGELAINGQLTKEMLEELGLDPITIIINLLGYNAILQNLL